MKRLVMNTIKLLLAGLLITAVALPLSAGVIYVDIDAPGGGDGTSWGTAYDDLQTALAAAAPDDSIWVVEGTYHPHVSDMSVSFLLVSGVEIYGGFSGSETLLSERDLMTNVTVLSGDIDTDGTEANNSYHVAIGSGTDSTAVLDGFTVTGGNAIGSGNDGYGGGLLSIGGSPTIRNVIFSNNSAYQGGGGISNIQGSSPTVVNAVFMENSTSYRWGGGGGIHNSQFCEPTFVNVTVCNNDAGTGYGGGMCSYDSTPRLINTIVWGNTAENSYNPQIWNNISVTEISYSIIEGCGGSGVGWDGSFGQDDGNNMDVEPLFADSDLRLKAVSPAVNSGNDSASGLPATDIDGNPRIAGLAVDMGAYEVPCPAGAIVYVDDDATGTNDGSSWANAFTDLQEALEWATCESVTEIWVAEGTYRPTASDDRGVAFQLVNGVTLYGGFSGTEMSVTERDSLGGATILSGDIGMGSYGEDNSYHVVIGIDTDSTAVLNGFTITLGNADGAEPDNRGGGIYLSGGNPLLTNVILTENSTSGWGGGLYGHDIRSTISAAVFSNNSADVGGGGMNISESTPTIVNSIFIGNTCAGRWSGGGGLGNDRSASTLINVTMVNNDAGTGYGGAMSSYMSTPRLINSIIWGNTAENSTNPQIWNNTSYPEISYSLIEGCGGSGAGWVSSYGLDYDGNIDTDPLFFDEPGTDLRLLPESPAVDAGAVDSLPAGIISDLIGYPRIVETSVDMGAYESQATCPPDSVLYVDASATGEDVGTSWTDAFIKLQDALEWAQVCPLVTQIWVAAGTYSPGIDPIVTDRTETFELLDGIAVYGGFTGMETDLYERDWVANLTVLSGDIGAPGDNTDNSYHVITASGTDATAVLDGFTITGGNANASVTAPAPALSSIFDPEQIAKDVKPTSSGAFVTGSRLVASWIDTHGGGITNIGGSPTLRNLVVSGNYAADGGGMYNDSGSPTLLNVRFLDNTGIWGGAVHNWDAGAPIFINVLFDGNAADFGAALYNNWSDPDLVNVTVYGNNAYRGGGLYNNYSDPVIVNSILWADSAQDAGDEIYNASAVPVFSYSLIEGSGGSLAWNPLFGSDSGNNIDADPMFADESAGDLSLMPGSPAINSGDNSSVPSDVTADLDSNPRIADGTVDMGANEYQPALAGAFPSPIVFEDVPMNETTCDTVYYTNDGGVTCTIEGIYGCLTAPFSIDTSMTVHTLAPGGTTAVVVCVHPTTAEPDSAQLVIVSNAANSPTVVEVRLDLDPTSGGQVRVPQPFRIVSVAPNPFNPSTTLYFTLPEKMQVRAVVYSVTGARIRVLSSGKRFDPGLNRLTWDGRTDRGSAAASGVYFIRLETKSGTDVIRAVLLR